MPEPECQVPPRHLTIIERHAPWREEVGPEWATFTIARLRYTAADKWTLHRREDRPENVRFIAGGELPERFDAPSYGLRRRQPERRQQSGAAATCSTCSEA